MITDFKIFEKMISPNKMSLPEDIIEINKLFKQKNKQLYVCGGAVRDFIIGIKPHDIDLVTNSKPNEIIEILKNKYKKLDLQGKQFGVIRVFTENFPEGIEIASYRKDLVRGRDNKGDHQKVDIETADIYSDSQRRDLSMNALYYDIETGDIIDLVGGIDDINNNIIRAVGNASERFNEDRLRILRTIRFAARNLSKIDPKTIEAIKKDKRLRNISKIDDVSQERIVEEFEKTIKWAKDNNNLKSLHYYLELLYKYDMFDEMFPELNININGINTFNISIIFALLFRNNDISLLKRKLFEHKVPSKISGSSCFLLTLKNDIKNLNKLESLYKDKIRYHVDNETIIEFANLYNFNDNYLKAFIIYKPTVDAIELMNQGLKGAELGSEIRRREIEKFKKLL